MNKNRRNQKVNKVEELWLNIPIITLNVNYLNVPIESQRLAEWIKNMTQLYAVYKKLTSNIMLEII